MIFHQGLVNIICLGVCSGLIIFVIVVGYLFVFNDHRTPFQKSMDRCISERHPTFLVIRHYPEETCGPLLDTFISTGMKIISTASDRHGYITAYVVSTEK